MIVSFLSEVRKYKLLVLRHSPFESNTPNGLILEFSPTHTHGHSVSFFADDLWTGQDRSDQVNLCLWSIPEIEHIVADKDRKDRLFDRGSVSKVHPASGTID